MIAENDDLLVLAETLGEVKTRTEKLEAEFSTQARPLESATSALSAALAGIKALQFHVIDNNLGALSARVEEMRKAVDEQVGVIALELKKADETNATKAGQDSQALRAEIAGLQAQLGTLGAQFTAQLERVEFAAKEEAKKLQLIPGPAGEAGASLNPRGAFIDGETYDRLDVVSWLGSSYIATVDGVTEKPSKNSNQWQVLASRGNGGGGTASLNDMLGAPSAGTIVGSEGTAYVRKTLVAGANIAITETPSTITITGTEGEISLEDGSAAAPSLFFINDPDTGIYRSGSNQLGISLGGSAQAVLTSTTFTVTPNLVVSGTGTSSFGGNATVGGTLTVNGGSSVLTGAAYSTFYADGSSGGSFTIRKAGVAYAQLYGNETNTVIDSGGSSNLILQTGGATRITMNSTRVSIPLTTASTSTSTGALVVGNGSSGGLGVGGAAYIGGALTVTGKIANSANSSISGDVATSVVNLSASGYGLRVQGGASGAGYILSANDYTGAEKFQIAGNGNATFAGNTNAFGAGGTGGANSQLILEGGSAANGGGAILYRKNGTVKTYAGMESSILGGGSTSDNYIIYTSSGLALTVAGQQVQCNATTASTSTSTGSLIVSGGVGVAGAVNVGGEIQISSAYPVLKLTDTDSNSDFSVLNDNGRLAVYDETNSAYRLTIGATGGIKIGTTPEDPGANNLTVQGAVAIGNTVNTVSPTSPNRTITMVIGGTTYYIHAKTTND